MSSLINLVSPTNPPPVYSLISYEGGSPGATTFLPNHEPPQAFALGQPQPYLPWANKDSLPQTVWWQFPKAVVVAKFTFNSRHGGSLEQSPRKFEFVASTDGADWTVLQTYETQFTALSQQKQFLVPAGAQGPFTYYGIRTLEVTSGKFVAIERLKMWEASTGEHL